MKVSSISGSVLASILVSGSLVAVPIMANADGLNNSTNNVQVVRDKAKVNSEFKIDVSDNGDGTKTISLVIPKGDINKGSDADLKNSSYVVKNSTDQSAPADDDTEVDNGAVKTDKDNAKIKINLDKSALSNDQFMNKELTITVKDNDGKTIGTVSGITAKDLMEIAAQQKNDDGNSGQITKSATATEESVGKGSSDTKQATSKSDNNVLINKGDQSTGLDKAKNADSSSTPQKDNQSNEEPNKDAVASKNDMQLSSPQGQQQSPSQNTPQQKKQQQNFSSVQEMIAAIKKNGVASVKDSTVKVTPSNVVSNQDGTYFDGGAGTLFTSDDEHNQIKAGQPVKVTINTVTESGANDKDNGGYDYYITYSQPQADNSSQNQGGQSPSGPNNPAGGGNASTNNGNNSQLPQTSDDNQVVAKSGVGLLGLISSVAMALGLKKQEN